MHVADVAITPEYSTYGSEALFRVPNVVVVNHTLMTYSAKDRPFILNS